MKNSMKLMVAGWVGMILNYQLHAQFLLKPAGSYAVGSKPVAVAAADVNGDGNVDLISANSAANTLSILTNNGSGVFGSNATYSVGAYPSAVVAVDVNDDGKVDLICTHRNASSLSVLTNNGSGGFALAATYPVGSGPLWVTAADINGDGKVDLITANWMAYTLSVLTNNGYGVFVSNATLAAGPYVSSVTTADVNGDGKLDLISAIPAAPTALDELLVHTNNGSGRFITNAYYLVAAGSSPISVTAADVNGDGNVDLIAANYRSNSVVVMTNNGSGVFGSNASYSVGVNPNQVVSTDVNGDGKADLISANYTSGTLSVLTNNGYGGFGVWTTLASGKATYSVAVADINGDGHMDLIAANTNGVSSGSLSVFIAVPTVKMNLLAANPMLSWSSDWTNWTLQQNADLATTNWITAGWPVTDDGTNKSVTLSGPATNLFFRLRSP